MYSVIVQTHFWAGHSVPLPDGSDEPVHRHNFAVSAQVSAEKLNAQSMVMDFLGLTKLLDKTANELIGKTLDQIGYFRKKGRTAEVIAEYFFERVEKALPENVKLDHITVTESPGCEGKFSG